MSRLGTVAVLGIPLLIAVVASKTKKTAPAPSPNGNTPSGGEPPPQGGGIPGWPPPDPPPAPPSGSWLDSLDEAYSTKRERQIYGAVADGLADPVEWYEVRSPGHGDFAGYEMGIPVMADALKIEGVRVTGSYPTAQAIADLQNWYLLTPHVAGLISEQAHAKLSPTTSQELSNKGVTATTSQMIEASRRVDQKLAPIKAPRDAKGLTTLVSNPGKDWVLTRQYAVPGKHPKTGVPHELAGANHGLYRKPWDPIQVVGMAHNLGHVDYSQTLRFMGPVVQLIAPDGTRTVHQVADVLEDPELAHMLTGWRGKIYGRQTGEGPLPYSRHPALPRGIYV